MRKNMVKTLAIVAGAAFASGCSTMAAETSHTGSTSTSITAADIAASKKRISELETALAAKDQDLSNARARISASSSTTSSVAANASLFPPNPKAGQCYARVLIPATYNTVSDTVLKRDAGEKIEIIPARYENAKETVLVKEASAKLEVVPAVYGEMQERVLTRPAATKIIEVPAVYETVVERILDKPAHTAWKKGPAAKQSANVLSQSTTDTGEIMCLVEVPASYKTVEKRVLVSAARTEEIAIPAEYKTIMKTVVKQPATTREVVIPAKYASVDVTKLVTPARENRIAIPAQYQTVTRTDKASDERMEWRSVMCEVNMTRDNVLALQSALADKGYYKAGIDGIIGGRTLSAAQKYALDNSLPAGSSYVPMEVVKSLNIKL